MLQLKNITKTYGEKGKEQVQALKGIDLEFRKSEFVSILGQSGCGKTTFLNIIGGLDNYTSGDLIINGKSTKDFKDRDWDTYRNHSVGFVFQSYNLIMHQTILSNIELALTLAGGISKEERRKRAIDALVTVGLGDKVHKKPTELSGGQMQRVAIARALVANPDILLADEPTGALDSNTSIQIMDLLKSIAKDRLVIMVTHNPELAEKYSTRIIKLLDGKVIDDSNPYKATVEEVKEAVEENKKQKRTHLKYKTALQLSLKNLMTKKGRTFLTGFAGSIGIIGIALILSLSHGMRSYIARMEEETLSSYPITLQAQTIDMSSMMETLMGKNKDEVEHEEGKIYTNSIMTDMLDTLSAKVEKNNLKEFKNFIENGDSNIKDYTNAVQYSYDLNLNIYKETEKGMQKVNPSPVMEKLGFGDMMAARDDAMSGFSMSSSMMQTNTDVWAEMIDNQELFKSQYGLIAGEYPKAYNEVVLKVDENNRISDYTLYSLGIKDIEELEDMMSKIQKGEKIEKSENTETYTYDQIVGYTFKAILNTDYYKQENGIWKDMSDDEEYMKNIVTNGDEIKIVGIVKPNEEALTANDEYGMIIYTKDLTTHVINKINESEIAKKQKENQDTNILTGMKFSEEGKSATFNYAELPEEQKKYMSTLSNEQISELMKNYTENAGATYESILKKLGVVDLDNPSAINIYPKNFDSKDQIANIIAQYNDRQTKDGKEENVINYTDTIGIMLSAVTSIINVITYVLIAFVAISLVVSSIMIAIITYISVLERTKEIGILRSIGASKKDVSRVFNAETFIEGLISGAMGILITLLLNIPINIAVKSAVNVSNIAVLPLNGAISLVILSIVLTVVAGLVPAKMAAKRDPAEALRSE